MFKCYSFAIQESFVERQGKLQDEREKLRRRTEERKHKISLEN